MYSATEMLKSWQYIVRLTYEFYIINEGKDKKKKNNNNKDEIINLKIL